ncbi:hypothetical protein DZK27_11230 [Rhodobacteraceae bacterium 63075]|nr:hypothetical protein DZK27_11230 [Rhodobacteraceae bacterium 63075]
MIEAALERARDNASDTVATSKVARDKWQVTFGDTLISLRLDLGDARALALRITARPLERSSWSGTETGLKRTLARVTAAMAQAFNADSVLWLKRDARFPTAKFIAAAMGDDAAEEFTRVQAARAAEAVQPRRMTPNTAKTQEREPSDAEALLSASARMRENMSDAEGADAPAESEGQLSLPLRLAAWIMTIMISVFSVPLAWILFAYNLNRGTDFRATAHVLALISSFSVLHSTGGTAQLYQMLFG